MSSTFCFSVAETLRCAGLTRQESLFLLIPALVEGLVGLPLLYVKWGKGKMYWLVVLEGIAYTILAVMDFFIHTRAADLSAMTAFKVVDIVIGAASFIPLLAYTLFLYLFANATLLLLLSPRWNRVVSGTFFLSIPIILAVTEVSSFIGVRYTPIRISNGSVALGVGFADSAALGPWNILANTSLALVTAYQAIHFCVAFLHFFQKAFRGERAFSASSERDVRLQSMKGTGWLAIGLKLGAVETALGFAGFTFTPTIVRRILRVVSRGFIFIGVSLSPDAPDTEGFIIFNDVPKRAMTQRSRANTTGKRDLRALISQPQTETFRRLDRTAADAIFTQDGGAPDMQRRLSQRVTVHFDAAKTPRLEMRFSDFTLPPLSHPSLNSTKSAYSMDDGSPVPRIQAPPPARRRGATVGSLYTGSMESGSAEGSDSLEAMKQVIPQFPRLPPRAMPVRAQTLPLTILVEEPLVRRKSSRRKPAPLPSPATLAQAFPNPQRISVRHDSIVLVKRPESLAAAPSPYLPNDGANDYEPSTPTSGASRRSSMLTMPMRDADSDTEPRTTPLYTPGSAPLMSQTLARSVKGQPRGGAGSPWTTNIVFPSDARPISGPGFHVEEEDGPRLSPPAPQFTARRHEDPDVPHSARVDSGTSWIANEPEPEPEPVRGAGRVKSVGAVRAKRPTPAPLRPPTHASVQLETLLSPDSHAYASPFAMRGEDEGGAQLLRADSVDSGVLSADDRADIHTSLARMRSRDPESPFP